MRRRVNRIIRLWNRNSVDDSELSRELDLLKKALLGLDEPKLALKSSHEVHITTDGEGNAVALGVDLTSAEQRVAQAVVDGEEGWDGRVGPIEGYDLD